MKLIYCNNCQDVFRLHKTTETCLCSESGGHYKEDGVNVVIYGPCKPIGFKKDEFSSALENQPENGEGRKFYSCVISKNVLGIEHVNSEDYESTEVRDWLTIFDNDLSI
jgi:hypothetical protein